MVRVCRGSAASGGTFEESVPGRQYGGGAETHAEGTQAGVEQPGPHLVETLLTDTPNIM